MGSKVYENRGTWRFQPNSESKDYKVISRDHNFGNRVTIAYKWTDKHGIERVFVAFEKQTADAFEITPREEAVQAFNEKDWGTLSHLVSF